MFDDDDIAVCPVCGAPHHRDCFLSLGHCFYADQHGTPQQWKRVEIPRKEEEQVCKKCGAHFEKDAPVCPSCGTPVSEEAPKAGPSVNPFGIPMPQVGNGEIDGVKESEIAVFVGPQYQRYLSVFKKISKTGKKIGWNWVAFFFPEYWLMSRKCYKFGILMSLFSVLTALLTGLSGFNSTQMANLLTASVEEQAAALTSPPFIALYVLMFISLIVHIFMGMFGDYLYKKKVFDGIAHLKEQGLNDTLSYMRAGGVNLFLIFITFFAVEFVTMYCGLIIQSII